MANRPPYIVQGIETRFKGPTNSRGSRYIATARGKSASGPAMRLVHSADYSMNPDQNHAEAARLLAEKLGWSGTWFQGGCADETGYNFVNVGDLPTNSPFPGSAFVVKAAQ